MTFQTMPDTTPKTTANMDKYPPTSKGAMSMPNRVVVTTKIAHQRIANIIMGMSHTKTIPLPHIFALPSIANANLGQPNAHVYL